MDNDTIQVMRELLQEQEQRIMQTIDEKFTAEREHTKQMFAEERETTSRMIDEKLSPIAEDVCKIKVTLEHDISDKLKAAHEGYLLHTEKLDQIQASIDDMAPTVTALDVLHQMKKNH